MSKTNDLDLQTWSVQDTGTSNGFKIVAGNGLSILTAPSEHATTKGEIDQQTTCTLATNNLKMPAIPTIDPAWRDWEKIAKEFKKNISKVEFEKEHTMIIGQSGSGNGIWKTGPGNHPQFASHFSSVYKQYLTEDKPVDIADSVTQTGKQVLRNMIIDLESAIQQRLGVEFFRTGPYSTSDLQALFVDHDVNNLVEKPVTALLGNDE